MKNGCSLWDAVAFAQQEAVTDPLRMQIMHKSVTGQDIVTEHTVIGQENEMTLSFSFQHCCNHRPFQIISKMHICHSNSCPKIPNQPLSLSRALPNVILPTTWMARMPASSCLLATGWDTTWYDVDGSCHWTSSVAGCGPETGGAHGGALRREFGPGVKLGAAAKEKHLTSWEHRRYLYIRFLLHQKDDIMIFCRGEKISQFPDQTLHENRGNSESRM